MQKILIVEDDIDIQDILKNHLIDAGYEVAVASDGVAGIAMFDDTIDLLLLDIMLPKIDGYHGSISMSEDVNRQLEDLYVKFNIDHPDDFRGHSMSVSDIVALKVVGEVSFHYVDSVGFQKLENFMKSENYLKNAEMAMEDDYGMIDGIINNGKASGLEERPSVLEQLKEKPVPDVSHKPPKSHPEREIE